MDAVGIKAALSGTILFDLDNANLTAHRSSGFKVARGLAKDQVASLVGFPGNSNGEVGKDARLP